MTSSLCPNVPNSHAQGRCFLGTVVFLRPGGIPRQSPELQCPKCSKVGRAQSEGAKGTRPPCWEYWDDSAEPGRGFRGMINKGVRRNRCWKVAKLERDVALALQSLSH
nr:uncharacterized protein LOC123568718 isoform X2 [Macaca fascicularis]